jgi:Protein of unknown function (DUF2750)
MSVAAMQARKF